jgi:hypothetical protein
MLPIKNGLKKSRYFLAITFQLCFIEPLLGGSGKPECFEIKWYTSVSGLC